METHRNKKTQWTQQIGHAQEHQEGLLRTRTNQRNQRDSRRSWKWETQGTGLESQGEKTHKAQTLLEVGLFETKNHGPKYKFVITKTRNTRSAFYGKQMEVYGKKDINSTKDTWGTETGSGDETLDGEKTYKRK